MFEHAELKIGRADKHVSEFYSDVVRYIKDNPHSVRVEFDSYAGCDAIHLFAPEKALPIEIALPIGDAIHNLCTAFDFAWYEFVSKFATPSIHTKFPFHATKAGVVNAISQRSIPPSLKEVGEFIVEVVQPYKGSNTKFWELHNLDITDKHEYLIPRLGMTSVWSIRAETDDGLEIALPKVRTVIPGWPPSVFRCIGHRNIKITNNGEMGIHVLFAQGPFEGLQVEQTLTHFIKAVGECLVRMRALIDPI
jgi:hypothetical protein